MRILFAALLTAACEVALAGSARAVDYGDLVPAGAYLPVGQVLMLDQKGQVAGWGTGTLIDKDIILTAAHVVEGAISPRHIQFVVNTAKPVQRTVIAYQTHPGYYRAPPRDAIAISDILCSDLAVLRLDAPADPAVGVYRLAERPPLTDTVLTAVGFGINESKQPGDARKMSGQLRFVTIKDLQLICASLPGKYQRTDSGDSGGPLLVSRRDSWEIAGTVRGKLLFETVAGYAPDEFGDYVSVYRHRDWIFETARSLQAITPARTYLYLTRPDQAATPYPALSLRQLEGLTRAGTPDIRIFERAVARGISEPLPEPTFRILQMKLGLPATRFVGLQMEPVPSAAKPVSK